MMGCVCDGGVCTGVRESRVHLSLSLSLSLCVCVCVRCMWGVGRRVCMCVGVGRRVLVHVCIVFVCISA